MQEDERDSVGGIQVQVRHQALRERLDVGMKQEEHPRPRHEHQESLGGLEGRDQAETGRRIHGRGGCWYWRGVRAITGGERRVAARDVRRCA